MSTFGPAYNEALDGNRVKKQHEVIRDFMLDANAYQTLGEIAFATGFPEASVSAQLRHLRKEKFGGYIVEKRRRSQGTWEYMVKEPPVVGETMDLF